GVVGEEVGDPVRRLAGDEPDGVPDPPVPQLHRVGPARLPAGGGQVGELGVAILGVMVTHGGPHVAVNRAWPARNEELAGGAVRSPAVSEAAFESVLELDFPVGSRIVVIGDLLLRRRSTASSDRITTELTAAIAELHGPGA